MTPKKVCFMIKKFADDIKKTGDPYVISSELQSQKLGRFYFLFDENPEKLNKLITNFDEEGIPLNSAYVDVEEPRLHYYPISIGQYALAVFNSYADSEMPSKKAHFMRIVKWFMNNKTEDEKCGIYWLTDISKPEYKINEPWKSAFTQSRAISVLLRAWQVTENNEFLETAEKALIPFTLDITEGGVSAFTDKGKIFEEYVAAEPTMVLDGHIFSLLGLYDFYRATKNHQAKVLFDEGIESLIDWLPEYDMGYWLKFNMCKMEHYPETDPCTIGYLRLVTLQMKLLYKITQRDDFVTFYEKFKSYDSFKNIIKMYPVKYRALKKLNRL